MNVKNSAFSSVEIERLLRFLPKDLSWCDNRMRSKFIFDLTLASAELFGNSYSQFEVMALIDYGEVQADKPTADAKILFNHKKAIEIVLLKRALSSSTIERIFSFFVDADEVATFQSTDQTGMSYADTIASSVIDAQFAPDPTNSSFILWARLSKLAERFPVAACAARVCCNIPLVNAGLSPTTFSYCNRDSYRSAMGAIEDSGDETLANALFLQNVIGSSFGYLPLQEETKAELANANKSYLTTFYRFVRFG